MKARDLDDWREFFREAGSDIFSVIEYAITIAASDCPKEFRLRRDKIAERLYACKLIRCGECDNVTVAMPGEERESGFEGGSGGKESKVNSSSDDVDRNRISNYSYDEAEALTEEIEEESEIVREVCRIKEVLSNSDESHGLLYESLRRLQLMQLSVETLKATEIGKAVNALRKHQSKQIRHIVKMLINGWKDLVDEWVNTATAMTGGSPDSVKPAVAEEEEEEGLPSPPLDEGAFLATQTTSIELSQFFDGMDDDGNPRSSMELGKNPEAQRKPNSNLRKPQEEERKPDSNSKVNYDLGRKPELVKLSKRKEEENLGKKEDHSQIRKLEPVDVSKQNGLSGPGRPPKLNPESKPNGVLPMLQQRSNALGSQMRPLPNSLDKPKHSEDVSVRLKFEEAKRKLQEGYQQAENAKKQRTIQVMELHDLPKPKQGMHQKHPPPKSGSHNRHWNSGWRP
ncbi:hypothetical protein AMTRI_Chr01g103500 [Amborella trichopoda]